MTIPDLYINLPRLQQDFEELAQIGATVGGGVTRVALSNEDLEARSWFAEKIEQAGLSVSDDDVGNLSGVLFSQNKKAKTLLLGSHLDTVPNGGKFDGSVGVLCALECLRIIQEANIQLPVHLEAINFTDEEGTWQSFFGSLGLTGKLEAHHINDIEQDNGAFRAALYRAGIRLQDVHKAKRNPDSLLAYLELHIEQGCILDSNNIDIGIVTGIVGRATYNLTFYGEAAHSGTTSMERRRDALQGAAKTILESHKLAKEYPQGVLNCGNVVVKPGAFNVIPAEVSIRIECRHANETILADMNGHILRLAQEIAAEYRLSVSAKPVLHRHAATMDASIQQILQTICENRQISMMPIFSYAGHDAQILSYTIPSGMIFIPSSNGISHNPKEFTDWKQIEIGANILLEAILTLANQQ